MRPLVIIIAATTLAWCAFHAFGQNSKAETRTIPPTVFLGFPESVQVDTVYIYPSSIAFMARRGLKPGSKLTAELSNIPERPHYDRKVDSTYLAADDTYWIQMPDDVPSEISIDLTFKK